MELTETSTWSSAILPALTAAGVVASAWIYKVFGVKPLNAQPDDGSDVFRDVIGEWKRLLAESKKRVAESEARSARLEGMIDAMREEMQRKTDKMRAEMDARETAAENRIRALEAELTKLRGWGPRLPDAGGSDAR